MSNIPLLLVLIFIISSSFPGEKVEASVKKGDCEGDRECTKSCIKDGYPGGECDYPAEGKAICYCFDRLVKRGECGGDYECYEGCRKDGYASGFCDVTDTGEVNCYCFGHQKDH